MILQFMDWLIIGVYFAVSLAIGIIMSRRAGRSTGDFFLSGRNLPWWIAGTSMVATTFAADTPLAVTELVAQKGIAGNWLWWNMIFGGMLTVFFFARLWRRAGILTDCEFVSIRYSGVQASFLRGFRAIYIGVGMNIIVIAWVNLAMAKILSVVFPDFTVFGRTEFEFCGFVFSSHLLAVGGLMAFVALYSAISGLCGVSITDSFQFVIGMTGCIVLAIYSIKHPDVGGFAGLKEKLPEWVFSFTPAVGHEGEGVSQGGLLRMSFTAFIAYICVQWWASWYPGAEPGGGGYVAQRMMSAKDEKHSLLATLWFNIAHFALRPWPWVIVALCSVVLFPELSSDNKGNGFVMMIVKVLPPGLVGLLMAAFFAAYMSTIASQTIWGTSYIINDFYRPFINKNATEKYYVHVSRITTCIILVISLIVTSKMQSISGAWKFILACSAGIGPVLILRWFWWRINAWSEIAAIIAPYAVYPILLYYKVEFEISLMIIVAFSSVVWICATFLTKPVDEATLKSFYRKVRPGGAGWKPLIASNPDVKPDSGYFVLFMNWVAGCVMVISTLFGIGKFLFGSPLAGIAFLSTAACSFAFIYYNLSKTGWAVVEEQVEEKVA